ncbi:ASPIC/UnbV domain protein [Emticicia oligotrophica DSM 17448]|uniref:ASPIC/UnbV domain protein n=1 Tax=Emticicia oligotrophica (strain DSM 17448 / CIP 109782 / MTCC 6937 / GPTSA100-15) TaxID=929562 RepID=A0ABN4AKN4_EMTOG|nr:VCBS repeat-containing protein [Emticicia oligotrophica]AFK02771.1 ASPIC/UnbV domain protein [Emticicia oligotrophica DSM 17448]
MKKSLWAISCAVLLLSCSKSEDTLFESLPSSATGIDFVNRSLERKDFNIFNYRNFYNGGGVAIGDINNDGLSDIFVTSNFEDNKLYLNKGKMTFEDITVKAGIVGKKFWSTGVTFADVNGDGLMDIYVCNSGSRDQRGNQLYINQGIKGGIPSFVEKAAEAGLEDGGFSTHAAFFDYDRDGDLDMYLLNNSFTPIDKLGYMNLREERDKLGGDKLFRNDSPATLVKGETPKFTDVSAEAGIYGSLIGFGLGITIGDVNNDNWPDIYISNDFYERDYLYINQKNGTFKEDLVNEMPHISLSSMGADIADINNDGNLDIFVTDMLPGDDRRLKTTSVFEGYNLVDLKLKRGFWHQYMRNNLQLNNGDGTFSEVGQLAGVHATDWSWGALIFDMDNDGLKDLFVANGIAKDLTDQDFVEFLGDRNTMQQMLEGKKFNAKEFIDKISSVPVPNYAFKNNGNLNFTNSAQSWGLEGPGFSNGSAYGDLDNDGDLDLVVNNVNAPLSVFKNKTNEKTKNHFLTVKLKGTAKNLNGIGSTITVYQQGTSIVLQQMPNRGFQSSCDHQMVFGLGEKGTIDSLRVVWPDDKMQVLKNVKTNQTISLDYKDANQVFKQFFAPKKPIFTDITASTLDYTHVESNFQDYDRDVLLKQKYSTQGPAMAVGDVNGDGLDDLYLGGATGQEKQLFIQQKNGKFIKSTQPDFGMDLTTENTDAIFFDADKDNDLDLFIVTGSNEFPENAPELHDLLYLNDGKGNFKRDVRFPAIFENGSCVTAADFDKDGDNDLFVGSRMISGKYGYSPASNLYINDGTGEFKNQSKRYMPEITSLGMITDAEWSDIDKDGFVDLIITQDWGEIVVFKNERGKKMTLANKIKDSEGLWNCIKPADIDGDGDTDFIVGNIGDNTKLKVSPETPAFLHAKDFDNSGTIEQIISCLTEDGKTYPMVLKGELQRALPMIKRKYVKYTDYANQTITDMFTAEQMKDCVERKITTTKSIMLINDGKGNFEVKALPIEAQYSRMAAIETGDFDNDGILDILLAGNFYDVLPEWGRFDASYGVFLKGKGKGVFQSIKTSDSGFKTVGQVRKMYKLKTGANKEVLVLAKNNDKAQVFGFNK